MYEITRQKIYTVKMARSWNQGDPSLLAPSCQIGRLLYSEWNSEHCGDKCLFYFTGRVRTNVLFIRMVCLVDLKASLCYAHKMEGSHNYVLDWNVLLASRYSLRIVI